MSRLGIVLTIIAISTLASVLTTVIFIILNRKQVKKYLIFCLFMVICPVIGPLYLGLGRLMLLMFLKKSVDLEEISFSKERVKTLSAPDFEKEINIVPLEDALAVSDTKRLRRLLLDVLKDDKENSLPAIVLSRASDDSETSHYAASVLMDVLSDFSKAVGALHSKFLKEPEQNLDSASELVSLIIFYVPKNIFSQIEKATYVSMADNTAQKIYEIDYTRVEMQTMFDLCTLLLETGDSENAEKWAKRMSLYYPDTMERYKANLMVYYSIGNKYEFFYYLEQLKRSTIPVDYETFQLIRLFGKVSAQELQNEFSVEPSDDGNIHG